MKKNLAIHSHGRTVIVVGDFLRTVIVLHCPIQNRPHIFRKTAVFRSQLGTLLCLPFFSIVPHDTTMGQLSFQNIFLDLTSTMSILSGYGPHCYEVDILPGHIRILAAFGPCAVRRAAPRAQGVKTSYSDFENTPGILTFYTTLTMHVIPTCLSFPIFSACIRQ